MFEETRELIKKQGFDARKSGVPESDNPYQYSRLASGGLFRAAWWNAGWKQADTIEKLKDLCP